MRVLCLHGMGTNASIWESQTASFRRFLPQDWQWTFVDGEQTCEAAPGVDSVYEGPYLTYYTLPDFEAVQDCHELLDAVIEDEGPFDAVMGFSQGAALAASYLLRHQIESSDKGSPFRLAIFVNASLPFSWTAHHGLSMVSLFESLGAMTKDWKAVVPIDDGSLTDSDDSDDARSSKSSDSSEPTGIRRFHPDHDKTKIDIATVHIYGERDPYLKQSLLLQNLCTQNLVSSYQHGSGHDVPRSLDVSRAISSAILTGKYKAEFRM